MSDPLKGIPILRRCLCLSNPGQRPFESVHETRGVRRVRLEKTSRHGGSDVETGNPFLPCFEPTRVRVIVRGPRGLVDLPVPDPGTPGLTSHPGDLDPTPPLPPCRGSQVPQGLRGLKVQVDYIYATFSTRGFRRNVNPVKETARSIAGACVSFVFCTFVNHS